jgi:hypothetical protein
MNFLQTLFGAPPPTRAISKQGPQAIASVHGTSKVGFRPSTGAGRLGVGTRFGGANGNASGRGGSGGGRR